MDLLVLALAFVVILVGRGAVHQRHRVVRPQARACRGRRRIRPCRGRDRPPRDDDPDHRDPVRAGGASHEVGVGAILGAPFMLSTLAMFVTGVAVLCAGPATAGSGDVMPVDTGVLAHDMRYFAIAYAIAIGGGVPAARAGLAEGDRGGRPHRDLRAGTSRATLPASEAEDARRRRTSRPSASTASTADAGSDTADRRGCGS